MKTFLQHIAEAEKQEWMYMKKPQPVPSVDDYGRTIDTPPAPKKPKSVDSDEKDSAWTDRDTAVFYSRPGTEERAEKSLRTNPSGDYNLNTMSRKFGPTMKDAQKEKAAPDIKSDTKDKNIFKDFHGHPANSWKFRWNNMKLRHDKET